MKTSNSSVVPSGVPPSLKIAFEHHGRLRRLALQALEISPQVAQHLLDEIERADLSPSADLPADVVGVGSRVRYRDHRTGRENTIVLVWPGEADLAARRVSVLSPIGAALIGLSVGQSIDWAVEDGRMNALEVIDVRPG